MPVLDTVPLQCRLEEVERIVFGQVRTPVLLGDGCWSAPDNDAVSTLVVDLRNRGVQTRIRGLVERDSDIAGS